MRRPLLPWLALCVMACDSDSDGNPQAEHPPPPGYVLVEIASIDDPAGFADYSAAAAPTLVAHNFVPVVATPTVDRLGGNSPDAWSVVIRFASQEDALIWYDDPAYADARPLRFGATGETQFSFVEGLAEQTEFDPAAFHRYLHVHVDEITDQAAFDRSRAAEAVTFKRHDAVVLVDSVEARVTEGEAPYAWTLLVGFPDEEAVEQWRLDADAQSAAQQRAAASRGESSVLLPPFDPSLFE